MPYSIDKTVDYIVIRSDSDEERDKAAACKSAEKAEAMKLRRQDARADAFECAGSGKGREAGSGECAEAGIGESGEAGSGESGEAAQSALSFRSDSESSNISDFITEFHIIKGKMPKCNSFLDEYDIQNFWSPAWGGRVSELALHDWRVSRLDLLHDNQDACYLVAAITKTLNKCYPYIGLECPSIYKVVAFANVVHGILSPLGETEVENMCEWLDMVLHMKGWHLLLHKFYEKNNIAHLQAHAYINYVKDMLNRGEKMKFEYVEKIHEKKMINALYEEKDEDALFKLYKMLKDCRSEWGYSEDDSVLETSKIFFQCSADCCLALKLIHYSNNERLILRRSDKEWKSTFRGMLYYYCPDWCQGVKIKGVKVEPKDFAEQRLLKYVDILERFDNKSAPTLKAREEQDRPVKFKDGDEPASAVASTDTGGKRSRSEIAQDDERVSIYRRGSSAWRVLSNH